MLSGGLQVSIKTGHQTVALNRLTVTLDIEDVAGGVDHQQPRPWRAPQVCLVRLLEPATTDEIASAVVGEIVDQQLLLRDLTEVADQMRSERLLRILAYRQRLSVNTGEQLLMLTDREDDFGRNIELERHRTERAAALARQPIKDFVLADLKELTEPFNHPFGFFVPRFPFIVQEHLPVGTDCQRRTVPDQFFTVRGQNRATRRLGDDGA